MSETLRASQQYDDLRGTVAIDGHGTCPLMDWWKNVEDEKAGYHPVGARVGKVSPDEDGKISITMFAVRYDEAGNAFDDWVAFEQRTGSLPTYRFEARMTVEEFFRHIKRLEIFVLARDLAEKNVVGFSR